MNAKVRLLEMGDLDNIMKWVNDEEVIKNFQNFDKKITREEEEAYLGRVLNSRDDKMFAIETENGEYIGNIGLHQINSKNKLGRLGIIIGNREYWGKGYAQSAINEVLRYAFEDFQLNKVWIMVFKENERMKYICKKAGFDIEGILRQEYSDKNGRYHDMVRMAILQEDYVRKKNEHRLLDVKV